MLKCRSLPAYQKIMTLHRSLQNYAGDVFKKQIMGVFSFPQFFFENVM